MNLLCLTPYLPYPGVPHGGGQDLLALLRFLAPRHTLRLASFVDEATAVHADALRTLVPEVCLVRPAVTPRQKAANTLAALRSGQWAGLGRRAEAQVLAAIRAWAAAGPAEVLYCAWTEMGRHLRAAPPGAVRVLDEVDVRWRAEAAAAAGRPWRWPTVLRRRQAELGYVRSADLVLARSAHDLAALRQAVPRVRGLVLPPVAHTAGLLRIAPGASRPGQVLFVGALDRVRNQQAARWLAEAVWPRVRAAHPAAELRLVGAHPPAAIQALGRHPGVTVVGWAADLAAEYAKARVVAAPLFGAAGALNKVIDGLAAGRPVVATQAANAGVGAPPQALVTADRPVDFATALVRLLADDALWQRMAAAARRFAAEAFDWEAAAGRLETTLVTMVEERKATSAP